MAKKNRAMEKEKEGKTQSNQPPNKTKQTNQYKEDVREEPQKKEEEKQKKRTYNLTLNYIQITLHSIYIIQ